MVLPDNFSWVLGTFTDVDSSQHAPTGGSINEWDWFTGVNYTLAGNWKLGVQFAQFTSPPGYFTPEDNVEFSASYDDSKSSLPVKLAPYVKLFWNVSGDSPVITGQNTFDVELGVAPSYNFGPVALSAPTWLTAGPARFWGGSSNIGVVTTGLTATVPIKGISWRYGNWSVKFGFQYYDFVNPQLRFAQTEAGSAPWGSGGHKSATLVFGGISMGF